jgi:CheY-like chemotaxis protein
MLKLLIVEDQKMQLEAMVESLETQGYTILQASTGEEAISVIQEQKPELILLDLYLEDMTGLRVLIKAKEFNPKCCVIILTGFDVDTTKEKAFSLGADYFLIKPIPLAVLKQCLSEAAKTITEKDR